ncbi:AzlD domain-containing protein [Afifella sp. H1R]|uniref:AzlD domain-containing protein n=1 Tax=unclassified Afifella TaxID=2624128 RepID=UPI001F258CCA|nr:AzlD domain-containing protein [Afifella sp. H1R]MCF1503061.1 AzlD domain-containing protein [Afifella sp. H1R]
MPDVLSHWQLWAVAAGAGLGTLLLRLVPLFAREAIGGERIREFFDRAGYGILGGIVATSALRSGQGLFHGAPLVGSVVAIVCVVIAFTIAVWKGGTIVPTLIGLAGFVAAGLLYLG